MLLRANALCKRKAYIAIRDECILMSLERINMTSFARRLWKDDAGQDIAEYAVMLAVILVLVVGTIRLVGSNANNVFSSAASSIQ
jgi:Flp pilus assembly pilin Flp